MESTISENQKNISAAMHVSTFLKYFFPFANFFVPLLIWTTNKEKDFVDEHGKQALNFQLSILLYTLVIGIICLPFFIMFASDFISLAEAIDHTVHHVEFNDVKNITGFVILFSIVAMLLFGIFVLELYSVITATMHAAKGEHYKYPLSIQFIKSTTKKPLEHEHSN